MDNGYIRELVRSLESAVNDDAVIAVVQDWLHMMRLKRRHEVDPTQLSLLPPNKRKTIAEFTEGPDTYRLQLVKCGKKDCKCIGGACHGPYWYAFWRSRSKLKSRYIGKQLPKHLRGVSVQPQAIPDLPAPQAFAAPSVTDLAGTLDGWAEPTSAGVGDAQP